MIVDVQSNSTYLVKKRYHSFDKSDRELPIIPRIFKTNKSCHLKCGKRMLNIKKTISLPSLNQYAYDPPVNVLETDFIITENFLQQ